MKKISEAVKEAIAKNTATIHQVAMQERADPRFLEQMMGLDRDPVAMSLKIGGALMENNIPESARSLRAMASTMQEAISELDRAGLAFDAAGQRMSGAAGRALEEVRGSRQAIVSEAVQVTKAVKDVTDMIQSLHESGAIKTMGDLVSLGHELRRLYGEKGLDRLAEALLTAAERK